MVLMTTLMYLFAMMLLLPFLYLGAVIMADIGKTIKSKLAHSQTNSKGENNENMDVPDGNRIDTCSVNCYSLQ